MNCKNMKTYWILQGFLPLAAAALLSGGCSNDKIIPAGDNTGQPIAFRVQNGLPDSKAVGLTAAYINAFVINGYVDQVDTDRKSGRTLFERTTVSREIGSGANVFSYSPAVYYPKGAEEAWFSAFSPVSSRISASDFATGDPMSPSDNRITYTVPSPARGTLAGNVDVAPQEDLLVAHTHKDALSGAVILQFRHALARVAVKAYNLIDQPVRIHALSLHNLYTTGTLDIDADTWPDNAANGAIDVNETRSNAAPAEHAGYKTLWDVAGQTRKSLAWQLAESGLMVPVGGNAVQVTADDQALLVLPQTTQNIDNDDVAQDGDFFLEVAYTVGNISETIQVPFTDVYKLAPASNEGVTFEMGRQYLIGVIITATGLRFSLDVQSWDEPEAMQFAVIYDDNMRRQIGHTVWATEQNYKVAGADLFTTPPATDMSIYSWNTKKDGSGTAYLPGADITVTDDMTLYAMWRRDFTYINSVRELTINEPGNYRFEAWGAASGVPLNNADADGIIPGGYTAGTITLKTEQVIYVCTGQKGQFMDKGVPSTGTWNGGGKAGMIGDVNNSHISGCEGGGATDFRLYNNNLSVWDDATGLNSRILVAGGAGGPRALGAPEYSYGGGVIGGKATENDREATQTDGNAFGVGGEGNVSYNNNGNGGGGGGYYGGYGSNSGVICHGGGGSAFISGLPNCVAINPADTTNDPRPTDSSGNIAALNYNKKLFGLSPTWNDGDDIVFTDMVMIDGAGYEWLNGVKEGGPPSYQMPKPGGGTYSNTERGHLSHGYARVTFLAR
jgi:hypothetical protein